MRRRGWLAAAYGISLLLLGLILAWALVSLAMPGGETVDIGPLSDFPPSAQPYELNDPIHVFVVNDGGNILVLDSLNRLPGGHVVRWHPQEGYFIDPGRGTWFDLLGRPVRHILIGGVRATPLLRYPFSIRDGHILVAVER